MSKITVHGVTIEIEGDPIVRVKPDGTVTVVQRQKETAVEAAPTAATVAEQAQKAQKVVVRQAPVPPAAHPTTPWETATYHQRGELVLRLLRTSPQPVLAKTITRRLGLHGKLAEQVVWRILVKLLATGVVTRGGTPRRQKYALVAGASTQGELAVGSAAGSYDAAGVPSAVFHQAAVAEKHASMLKLVWAALQEGPWVNFRDICGRIGFDPNDVADFSNGRQVSSILQTLIIRGYVVTREHGGHAGRLVYATVAQARGE